MYEDRAGMGANMGAAPGHMPSPAYQRPGYAPPPAYQEPAHVHTHPHSCKKILLVAPMPGTGQSHGMIPPRIKHSESITLLSEEEKKTKIKELEEIDEMINNPDIYKKMINLVKYIMPSCE